VSAAGREKYWQKVDLLAGSLTWAKASGSFRDSARRRWGTRAGPDSKLDSWKRAHPRVDLPGREGETASSIEGGKGNGALTGPVGGGEEEGSHSLFLFDSSRLSRDAISS